MNNKGFIATSLIYSFFLIFITLFLTIIADHLQNKVLLNTIEDGIKDELNNTKSIEDFDVGDILTFSGNAATSINSFLDDKSVWIVAGIQYDNKDTETFNESQLILYKTIADLASFSNMENIVTEKNIYDDLKLTNNLNDTRINELINSSDSYAIHNQESVLKFVKRECTVIENNSITYNCTLPSDYEFRRRVVITPFTNKFKVNADEIGGFTVTEVLS